MKFTKIVLISLLLLTVVAACGSAPAQDAPADAVITADETPGVAALATDASPTTDNLETTLDISYENALSTRQILALGILKLEESELPVNKEQASTLLTLWQGFVNLTNSGTSAEAEVNALLAQIESTLTPGQIELINEMKLTVTDTQTWAQESGLTLGTGTGTGTGTGQGQGQGSNLTDEEKATRQAANNPSGDSTSRENSLSNALTQALIEYLESKSK